MSASPVSAEKGFTLGAEPKKVGALVLIMAIAAVLWWRNSGDSPTSSSAPAPVTTRQQPGVPPVVPATAHILRRHGNQNERSVFEMRPIDPSRGDVDPTLRLELLDRLRAVKLASVGRSLFESGTAPAPAAANAVIIPKAKPGPAGPIIPPQPTAPSHPETPPPPPIPLKFYGYIRAANKGDVRRGFFMDGDVILVATEGETIKQRYRVVTFQDNSATMEDTVTKSRQTLTIVPEARGEN